MVCRASRDRVERVVDAARELHAACYDMWNQDDDDALGTAYAVMKGLLKKTMENGEEIEDWDGGPIGQSDVVLAVLGLLETYDADKKGGE